MSINPVPRRTFPEKGPAAIRMLPFLSPLLLTMAALLCLYADAAVTAQPVEVLRPLLFLWILLALLAVPTYWLLHDWDWVGILLTVLVSTLFFSPTTFRMVAVVMSAVFLIWCCFALVRRRMRRARSLTPFLAAGSSLFMLIPIVFLGATFLSVPLSAYATPSADQSRIVLSARASKPDIYYIVLDSYARADILHDYYSFDNSEFIGYLKSRGFVVPEQAHSNYAKTVLSLSSTLNMEYVQTLTPQLADSPFWWQMAPFVDHSRLRAALEHVGYESYATAIDWDITDNRTVDHYYSPYLVNLTDLEGFFLNTTPLGAFRGLLSPFASVRTYQVHGAFIENGFAALSEISHVRAGPKFVFAHSVAVHAPFVYDAAGNLVTPSHAYAFGDVDDYPSTREEYREQYIARMQTLNSRLRDVIEAILANSSTPPIIVLQADHGPGTPNATESLDNTCIRERFSIFTAYYLPGTSPTAVPTDISSVNAFRIILDRYFQANLPVLENASYYSREHIRVGRLEDVTARTHDSCVAQGLP